MNETDQKLHDEVAMRLFVDAMRGKAEELHAHASSGEAHRLDIADTIVDVAASTAFAGAAAFMRGRAHMRGVE